MTRKRALSRHAQVLLAALLEARGGWTYGYEIATLTGIKSGTLYPLLIRLEAQGYLDAEWQQPVARGRPPRHAYRLTAAGLQLAQANAPDQAAPVAGWRAGEAAS